MVRTLLTAIGVVLAVAPAGLGVGVALASNIGAGLAAGFGAYMLTAGYLLIADVVPDRETTR